jgi:hypothetical protein
VIKLVEMQLLDTAGSLSHECEGGTLVKVPEFKCHEFLMVSCGSLTARNDSAVPRFALLSLSADRHSKNVSQDSQCPGTH